MLHAIFRVKVCMFNGLRGVGWNGERGGRRGDHCGCGWMLMVFGGGRA